MDRKETLLQNIAISHVKVQWKHFRPEEATWELEEDLQKYYPTLFQERDEHLGQCCTKGGKDVISPKNKLLLKSENTWEFISIFGKFEIGKLLPFIKILNLEFS